MKILIVKPSSLGDVVHALPVLRLLKQHYPGSEIYWWIDAGLAGLLEGDRDLAGIIHFQRKRWAFPWHWDEMVRTIFELRQHRFDLVLDLQGLMRSAIFAWLANGGFTFGADDPRERAAALYDDSLPRPTPLTHAVDWNFAILRRLNVPVDRPFEWMPSNESITSAVRKKWDIGNTRWIAINPGARWENKVWPAEYYADLVRLLANSHPDFRFAVLGDRNSTPAAEQICAVSSRCLNLAGKTSLREMVEWIRLSEMMVTNDTGPMHVAAALGKPVVAIFGPTNPLRTGPYGQIDQVVRLPLPCSPCMKSTCANPKYLECLRAISPQQVHAEIYRRLR